MVWEAGQRSFAIQYIFILSYVCTCIFPLAGRADGRLAQARVPVLPVAAESTLLVMMRREGQ